MSMTCTLTTDGVPGVQRAGGRGRGVCAAGPAAPVPARHPHAQRVGPLPAAVSRKRFETNHLVT